MSGFRFIRINVFVLLLLGVGSPGLRAQATLPAGILSNKLSEALVHAAPGNRALCVDLLQEIAATALKSGDVEAWAWAGVIQAEQTMAAENEGEEFIDLDPMQLTSELITYCEREKLPALLARALNVHAECQSQLGHLLAAAQEWERASALALDIDVPADAVTYALCAARVYRNLGHAAKVRTSQSWLDLILSDRTAQLGDPSRQAVEKFRTSAAALLALTESSNSEPSVTSALQPLHSSVVVSSAEHERGRNRITLTNRTTYSVHGELALSSENGNVSSWNTAEGVTRIIFRPHEDPVETIKKVHLLPGETLKIFVDYRFAGGDEAYKDTVEIIWTEALTTQTASAQFHFMPGAVPQSQITNASRHVHDGGWPTPFYHELYYRGGALQPEYFRAIPSTPARLEIYNEDNGQLMAVDADGDGRFDGTGDFLDHSSPGAGPQWPRLIVGPNNPVGSMEIYVFPLPGTNLQNKVTLSLADYSSTPATWREDSVDEQLEP